MNIESLLEVLSPELLLAVGGFVLNLLILPTLLDSDAAVPRTQSVLSAVVMLLCFAIPYYVIGFYGSAVANSLGVVAWTLVAVYRAPPSGSEQSVESSSGSSSSSAHPAD